MSFEAAVHAQAIELDHLALDMTAAAGSGHPSTSMSLGHLVTVLMFHTMRWSPEQPDYPTSDRLVLSEGHAVPIVYAACAKLGVMIGKDPSQRRPMTIADAMALRTADSEIDGHPNPMEGFPFFDAATGSLGQGLSVAAGLALGARLDGLDKHIYCIIGDGESREGQIAEALDFIMDHKLVRVLPIFNCNHYGQTDRVSTQQSAERMTDKLKAFGFDVRVIDGHDPEDIKSAFDAFVELPANADKPMAIVAKTVKGWGSTVMQGNGWHGKPATGDSLAKAKGELDQKRGELCSSLVTTDSFTIEPPAPAPEKDYTSGDMPAFSAVMKKYDMESVLHSGKLATRKAYGVAMRALGHINKEVVVLDADVSNSTFAETFRKDAALAPRFIECKIAEQNMYSVAAGLSAAGKVPFCSTFAKFVTRGYDQIEMAMNSGANLKVIGSHAGVSLAADGPSQMSLPDIAWFRSLATVRDHRGNPGCYVLQPADAFAAYGLTAAMAEHDGMCYMRTLRPETEFLYSEDTVFNLGAFEVLNEGRDLLIVSAGYMVHECNKALNGLDKAGVTATLVDLYSIPFDADALLDLANKCNGYVLTVEDNYGAGLGSAVADALADSGDAFTLKQMFVRQIPKSAQEPEEILDVLGLSHKHIVENALALLGVGV